MLLDNSANGQTATETPVNGNSDGVQPQLGDGAKAGETGEGQAQNHDDDDSDSGSKSTNLVEVFRSRGYELDDDYDDDQFLSDFEELQKELESMPDAEKLQQYQQFEQHLPKFQEFLEWQSSQEKSKQETEKPEQKAEAPAETVKSAPELHPEIAALLKYEQPDEIAIELAQNGQVYRDPESGMFKSKLPELGKYAEQLNTYERSQRKFAGAFTKDPVGIINKIIEPVLQARLKELEEKFSEKSQKIDKVVQRTAAEEEYNQVSSLWSEEKDRWYNADGTKTAQGQAYSSMWEKLLEQDRSDFMAMHKEIVRTLDAIGPMLATKSEEGNTGASPDNNGATTNGRSRKRTFLRKKAEEGSHKVGTQPGDTDRTPDREVPNSEHVPQMIGRRNRFLEMAMEERARQS